MTLNKTTNTTTLSISLIACDFMLKIYFHYIEFPAVIRSIKHKINLFGSIIDGVLRFRDNVLPLDLHGELGLQEKVHLVFFIK